MSEDAVNQTGLVMPIAVRWPWMGLREHQCFVAPGSGPCPHPLCGQGVSGDDTYFVAESIGAKLVVSHKDLDPIDITPERMYRRRELTNSELGVRLWAWVDGPLGDVGESVLALIESEYRRLLEERCSPRER